MRVLAALARRIWPRWETLSEAEQRRLLSELVATLISLPLLFLTTIWLATATDFSQLRAAVPFLLLLLLVSVLARRIFYFQVVGREAGEYSFNSSDLENVITTSAVLIVGPLAIWVHQISRIIHFLTHRPVQRSTLLHANWLRNLLFNLWTSNVGLLSGYLVYRWLGGAIPLADLSAASFLPALAFIGVEFVLTGLMLWLLIWQYGLTSRPDQNQWLALRRRSIMRFFAIAGLPSIFGILGAAIHAQMALPGYLFFIAAVLLVSFLARRQSQATVLSQQRARQLGELEQLGRAFIELPADLARLPEILHRYLPRMFDYDEAEIRLVDDSILLRTPAAGSPRDPELWAWLQQAVQPAAFVKGERLPWREQEATENLLLAPIRHTESGEALGGICLRSRGRITTIGMRESLPSLQVLAAQIASVLQRREVTEKRMVLERMTQELMLAREMQKSFLPLTLPEVAGWELCATLKPARQTSGDFYDIIELGDGRVGLLVADVADKGMSAALFMALSRTLLRTYAIDFPQRPELALQAANRRILTDTTDDSFVTVFYGVLEPHSGRFCWVNAGHNPPFLFSEEGIVPLQSTGMPLGIRSESQWSARELLLRPNDLLVLYSDGITDAHDADDELFGATRLQQVVAQHCDKPLPCIETAVLEAANAFAGDRPQFDDMTLLMARRKRA